MKIVGLWITLLFSTLCFSQPVTIFCNRESLKAPVYFFGYDFTHARLIDKKPKAKELPKFISGTTRHLNKTLTNKKVTNAMGVDSIFFDLTVLNESNSRIVDSTIINRSKLFPDKDSLQAYLNQLPISQKTGTGIIIFFESFERKTNITSALLVVMNNDTRKIICTEYIRSYDGNQYNRLTDWHYASYMATLRLFKQLRWSKELIDLEAEPGAMSNHQDSTFKPTIFKSGVNELPVTFGVGPAAGFSSTFISGGLLVDADIYHILIGYRNIKNPLFEFMSDESYNEQAWYLGYRFRKRKYSVSVGSGIGKIDIRCTSGVGADCDNFKEETVSSVPIFLEYAYYKSPFFGVSFSWNASIADRTMTFGLLAGIKIGIFRNPNDYKYR